MSSMQGSEFLHILSNCLNVMLKNTVRIIYFIGIFYVNLAIQYSIFDTVNDMVTAVSCFCNSALCI